MISWGKGEFSHLLFLVHFLVSSYKVGVLLDLGFQVVSILVYTSLVMGVEPLSLYSLIRDLSVPDAAGFLNWHGITSGDNGASFPVAMS